MDPCDRLGHVDAACLPINIPPLQRQHLAKAAARVHEQPCAQTKALRVSLDGGQLGRRRRFTLGFFHAAGQGSHRHRVVHLVVPDTPVFENQAQHAAGVAGRTACHAPAFKFAAPVIHHRRGDLFHVVAGELLHRIIVAARIGAGGAVFYLLLVQFPPFRRYTLKQRASLL